MDGFLKLDWLTFTYHVSMEDLLLSDGSFRSPLDCFIEDFPELGLEYGKILFDSGKFHYSHRFVFSDSIEINCCEPLKNDGTPIDTNYMQKMGVNVSVPSHSLDLFANLFGISFQDKNAIADMFRLLRTRGCDFSRIDICFDDYEKKYTAFDYARWWVCGNIVTDYQNTNIIGSCQTKGYTFYLGDRKHKMLRIYDKDFESGGHIDSVRYEFEYHGIDAKKIADFLIVNEGLYPFKSILLDWLTIITIDKRSLTDNLYKNYIDLDWLNYVKKGQFNEQLIIPEYNDKERQFLVDRFVKKNLRSILGFAMLHGFDGLLDELKMLDGRASPKYEKYFKAMKQRFKERENAFVLSSLDDVYILNDNFSPFD